MALLLTPLQVAKADPIAYEVTTDVTTPFSQFGTVDLATGAFKQTSVLGFVPTGISRIGSSLYTSTFTGTAFGQINPVTGAVTTISNTGLGGGEYLAMGSTLTTIYALDGSFNLYTVNPLTGAATLIGPTGLVLGLAYQLSTGSSALYFGDNNEIYSLNTSTGAPTAIGSTLLPVGGIDGLVFEHGGLYGGYYNRRLPSWFNLFDRSRDRRGNIHRDAEPRPRGWCTVWLLHPFRSRAVLHCWAWLHWQFVIRRRPDPRAQVLELLNSRRAGSKPTARSS